MQRNVHVLRHTLWNIVEHCFVRLQSLKPVVGTFIQYLLDGDTFIIHIQCCVLEVLQRIIYNVVIKLKSQNTDSWKINFGRKKKSSTRKKTIINYARNVHVLRHTLWNIVEHYVVRLQRFETCSRYINTVPAWCRHFFHTYSMLCTWSAGAYN